MTRIAHSHERGQSSRQKFQEVTGTRTGAAHHKYELIMSTILFSAGSRHARDHCRLAIYCRVPMDNLRQRSPRATLILIGRSLMEMARCIGLVTSRPLLQTQFFQRLDWEHHHFHQPPRVLASCDLTCSLAVGRGMRAPSSRRRRCRG